jgi:hypothetical protein
MKITNKFGLPETIVNVLMRPAYTKGGANLSATEILTSPRIIQLKRIHQENLEQDAADMVWSLFGTAVHNILEHGKSDNHVIEERLFAEIDGWTISGAIDLQTVEEKCIHVSDYKTTGAWSVMNEKADWVSQLNIYAWLVEKVKNVPVGNLEIVAIIRDWSRRDSEIKEGYPKAPIVCLPIPLWSFEDRENFIRNKLHQHAEAHFATETNGALPECTPDDMWEKPSVWAIKKDGNMRAKVLCYSEEEAQEKLKELGKGYIIEHRQGERTRCKNYCQVSQFCQQWAEYNGREA